MGNLDELYDIYQSFLDSVSGDFDYLDTVKRDDTGKERALLAFSNGFNVELANKQDVENSATLRCWWYAEENAVEIETLDQLLQEFNRG